MKRQQFEIKITHQSWVKNDGKDDVHDLCSHGNVYLRIGNEEILNQDSRSWTLSSTALYLMRTVFKDYEIGAFGGQLIPCCGHFFVASEDGESVEMMGCPSGIDWTIRHGENNRVKHITVNGEEGEIDKEAYRKIVLEFANEVEGFYQKCKPKVIPTDDFDKKGYEAFWKEWRSLKRRIENERK